MIMVNVPARPIIVRSTMQFSNLLSVAEPIISFKEFTIFNNNP